MEQLRSTCDCPQPHRSKHVRPHTCTFTLVTFLLIYLFILSYLPRSTPSVRSTVLPAWGSCITCMTKQTSISIHSIIMQWLHWLHGACMHMLTTYTCSSLQWLHAGAGSCLVNIFIWLMWHLIFITRQVPEMLFGFTFKIVILFNWL